MPLLLTAAACSFGEGDPPPPEEPLFAPGEYGGGALPNTEHIWELWPSPDGERIALIRKRTPGVPSDPRNQLWILDRDGSDPELISVNTLGAHWHPDGDRLAVTVATGIDFYVYTIDLETREATQWSGRGNQRLSFPVVSSGGWFRDGRRLLVFVHQKAYQQPFPRGTYIIDTQDSTTIGPIVELFEATRLGNDEQYIIGQKYVREGDPLSGNFARYDLADSTWQWITAFSEDSLVRYVDVPVPSPTEDLLVQSRETLNADQLFLMNSQGENVRQITELGGDIPRWSPDGGYFIFRRDVHKGEGARYVPFRFDLDAMQAAPLWPALPDSVPDFPDLLTQTFTSVR